MEHCFGNMKMRAGSSARAADRVHEDFQGHITDAMGSVGTARYMKAAYVYSGIV